MSIFFITTSRLVEDDDNGTCHFCKDPFRETTEQQHHLPCGHSFGDKCLFDWAKNNPPFQGPQQCILCCTPFYLEEVSAPKVLQPSGLRKIFRDNQRTICDGVFALCTAILVVLVVVVGTHRWHQQSSVYGDPERGQIMILVLQYFEEALMSILCCSSLIGITVLGFLLIRGHQRTMNLFIWYCQLVVTAALSSDF